MNQYSMQRNAQMARHKTRQQIDFKSTLTFHRANVNKLAIFMGCIQRILQLLPKLKGLTA